jgi:hypothetical protein
MVARDVGDELVFNGDKFFSTGKSLISPQDPIPTLCYMLTSFDHQGGVISDVTVLEGVLEDESKTHVFAFVSTLDTGISFKGDWDVIGQRLTVKKPRPYAPDPHVTFKPPAENAYICL